MKTVSITASRNYEVRIGAGLLSALGDFAAEQKRAKRVCIVSDSNVWPLHGPQARESLRRAGLEVCEFVFPAGEESKSGQVYLELLNFLALHSITRTDLLVALGGGVTGDLAGFAAATFLRGIAWIQVPTTLLAAVDSSVGGKTAIDLPAGKNLAGAFYQPWLVLCDTATLETLPESVFRDGCAEVIKYGVLFDPALFSHLHQNGMNFHREDVITRCVEWKRDVVARDEFDTGCRMLLNLGHTVGHGIEAQSHFQISHGAAVAAGMAIVTRAGCKWGICQESTRDAVLETLEIFGLPTTCACPAQELFRSALSDKKRAGDTIRLIIPRSIGDCIIRPTAVDELLSFIEAGL